MPKVNTARITDAQRQRQNISKKSEKYGSSTVYLQVLGSGACGVPNTLYMFTDQKRYLFNCGECTQRLAHEHKVKLSKLDHIFITNKTWKNIGGLPGLSLTLQDVGVPNITLHGPEGLDELYNATKRFVIMKEMNVTMAKCKPDEDFEDNVMSVKYVLLGPDDDVIENELKPAVKRPKLENSDTKAFEQFIHDETDYYRPDLRNMEANKNKDRNAKDNKHHIKNKTKKALNVLESHSHKTVAYICTLKKRLGTLDLAKCVEMGVKPGPMLGLLKSGQDVVLPDGTIIHSTDVKTPDDPGPVFIVLEVPDISYLKTSDFEAHFQGGDNPQENIPSLMVHYTPPHVFNHPSYRAFLAKFGPTTQHLVLNEQNSCLGSEAVHRTQHKLNLLDPDIFPLLRDISIPPVWDNQPPMQKSGSPEKLKSLEELKNKIAAAQFQSIINVEEARGDSEPTQDDKLETISGRSLTIYHLRPKKELDRSAEPKLHIQEYIQETMNMDGFAPSLAKFRQLVDEMRYAKNGSQKEYPKVVFLGTGSCIPSKTRNTSAIVFQIDENRSMLLDCGEGTFGQLVRFFGHKKVNSFLRTLKAIYISHLHADHHIGLFGVIQARRHALEEVSKPGSEIEPVYLLAPGQIVTWITLYDQQFEKIRSDLSLIPNQNLLYDTTSPDITPAILANIGASNIQTCLVSHCPNAFGVSIDVPGYKLTYSGDTIPCDELVKLGNGSTLLIHEATMEDELADEARVKMHSTTSQAINIGRRMNAKYTVLTHFSQRYARLPRLNAHILNDNRSVGIAFDNMQITMDDIELLPHMYAPLQLMFAEHCVEMELKAASRARLKERRLTPPKLPTSEHSSPSRVLSTRAGSKTSPTALRSISNYKETNASRLRQENKGMPVAGSIRPKQVRPPPSSPSGSSARSYTSRSPSVSGSVTPTQRRSGNNTKSGVISPSKTRSIVSTALIDSQSKTINSLSRFTNEQLISKISAKVTKPNGSPITSGYGKPLVTPITKKLTLRKHRIHENRYEEKAPELCEKCKSQVKSFIAECQPRALIPAKKNDVTKQSTKFPKKRNGPGSVHSNAAALKHEVNSTLRSQSSGPRDNSRTTSSPRRYPSPPHPVEQNLIFETTIRASSITKFRDWKKSNSSICSDSTFPSKESLGGSRSKIEKKEFCKPISLNGKPHSSIYSAKSFRPQLEDIKSSYLLLNLKPTHETKHKLETTNEKTTPTKTKPQPLNESERRRQLIESKKKYQSKRYIIDSKYEKIEGLNWVSWK